MGLHRDLTGDDLHVNKLHAGTHAPGGTDPVTLAGWVNVQQHPFGAKGDGSTDDTAAIQAAIDYADTNSVGVYIPKADYSILGTLNLHQHTNIFSNKARLLCAGGDIASMSLVATSDALAEPRIRGLIFQKNTLTPPSGRAIFLEAFCIGGLIEDCEFYDFNYGIVNSSSELDGQGQRIGWSNLNSFVNCYFMRNACGIYLDVDSNGVTIDKCIFIGGTQYGVYSRNSWGVQIINSDFELNGNAITGFHAISINGGGMHTISGCYMEGNGFNDTDSACILVTSSDVIYTQFNAQTVIRNNYINAQYAHTAIKCIDAESIVIAGNQFLLSGSYDIDVSEMASSNKCYISGNKASANDKIKGTGISGITVDNAGLEIRGDAVLRGLGTGAADNLGNLDWGNSFEAAINARISVLRGNGNYGSGHLVFATAPADAGVVERMRISSDGNIGIGTTPNDNAILDVVSTTKAFMPPRMTTTQRDAIASPTEGMVIFNTTTHVLNFYYTSWVAV